MAMLQRTSARETATLQQMPDEHWPEAITLLGGEKPKVASKASTEEKPKVKSESSATPQQPAQMPEDQGNPGTKVEPPKDPGLGITVPLNSNGFEQVRNDSTQMEHFVQRTVRHLGFIVANERRMREFAENCAGEKGPRSFDALMDIIFAAVTEDNSWVCILSQNVPEFNSDEFKPIARPKLGPGLTNPLNQEGYEAVSNVKSSAEMSVFMHRVINHLGLVIKNRWGLLGTVPWYDGTEAKQNYAALTTEILGKAMKPDEWVTVDDRL